VTLKSAPAPSEALRAFDTVVLLVQLRQIEDARKIAVTIEVEPLRAQALKLCNDSRPF
jgi:hypothetical protein